MSTPFGRGTPIIARLEGMTYAEFQALAERLWEEIPEAFGRGLQGLHAFEEPGLKGVFRLGEYLDPGPLTEGLGRRIAPSRGRPGV